MFYNYIQTIPCEGHNTFVKLSLKFSIFMRLIYSEGRVMMCPITKGGREGSQRAIQNLPSINLVVFHERAINMIVSQRIWSRIIVKHFVELKNPAFASDEISSFALTALQRMTGRSSSPLHSCRGFFFSWQIIGRQTSRWTLFFQQMGLCSKLNFQFSKSLLYVLMH